MKLKGRQVLLCNCERTMTLDPAKLARALGSDEPPTIHSHLCRSEAARYSAALEDGEPLLVACTQEAPLFRELASEAGHEGELHFANIRERAGWTADTADLSAKIAALLGEAALDIEPAGTTTLSSDGICLVYGRGQEALDAATKLQGRLNVSLLLADDDGIVPPHRAEVAIHKGRIVAAEGHFGAFSVTVKDYAPLVPSSRAGLDFAMARQEARAECSLILDLTGETPLFPSAERRDGYLRADPRDPAAIATALFDICDLVGEFEKPLYVHYDADLCAHSRNGQTGCTRCLDNCPASAISPNGDEIAIDPALCGGCGVCASVCPTGAASYRLPRREDLLKRIRTLVDTYLGAGGTAPVLLVHDGRHGEEMLSALARFGRGLPAHMLPLAVNETTQIGHEAMAVALAAGARAVLLLADPRHPEELEGLRAEARLVNALMAGMGHGGHEKAEIVAETDPDAVEAVVWRTRDRTGPEPHAFVPSGGKREAARMALTALNEGAPEPATLLALPDGAPYGRISVDTDGCTMCLACVSACPTGALKDNPDRPELRFVEQACVQCGLCRRTCPEQVIALEPRYNFTPGVMEPVLLNEEEPFACIRCGKPFGTKSAVERIAAALAGKHSMFRSEEAARLIRMCDDCRIETQAEGGRDPFAMGERPRVRTTQDYLDEAEAEAEKTKTAGRRSADDFLIDK